ncbi:helix-turn-helix domain-containing protein [Modicisalibacter sp. 'Wilcox']|uniref:helix-turn-helix domain-containing protein n=1 Tax=Modicisalibacter sp. 'Wilcox' TaxID=2679914 RepID=UPI0013D00454|nr:helix-turn-helix domain-containing protein [Modicisalibacter sp. 'Wilcox']
MQNSPDDRVPVFQLYGETGRWPTPDLLHCESIAACSRLHDWHIKPHRHADLLHLLHIRHGEVRLTLEEDERRLDGPQVIIVPPVVIHGFRFSTDTDGHIISLAPPLAGHLRERLAALGEVFSRAAHYPLADQPEASPIATLIETLVGEYHRPAPGREPLLHALMQALAVQVARRASRRRTRHATLRQDRGRAHLEQFLALIDDHYAEQPTIDDLAARVGITSAHLNTLCRRLAGRSALQLLHERLLLEAKRQLTYTNMTIGQIADQLGFSEPAYFTRFFKRLSGQSPKAFRQSR